MVPSDNLENVSPLDALRDRVGHVPDGEIAALAGVTPEQVKAYRRANGIAPFRQPPPGSPSAPQRVSADVASAVRAGGSVVRRRHVSDGRVEEVVVQAPSRLSEPPVATPARPRLVEPPARVSPPPVASKPAAPRAAAPRRVVAPPVAPAPAARRTPEASPLEAFRHRMGNEGDGAIAEDAGVDRRTIADYRKKHGIPAYDGFRFKKGERPPPPSRTPRAAEPARARPPGRGSPLDVHVALLGTMRDVDVAALAGTSVAAVTQYRRRRGIARHEAADATPVVPVVAARRAESARVSPPPRVAAAAPAGGADEKRFRSSKLDAYAHLVGVWTDGEVAKLAGVTSTGVRLYRRRHGIPVGPGKSAAELSSAAAAPVISDSVAAVSVPEVPVAAVPVAAVPVAAESVATPPAPTAPRSASGAEAAPLPVGARTADVAAGGPDAGLTGWRQAFRIDASRGEETLRFVALGHDIREALEFADTALAARGGGWTLDGVKRLGEGVG